MNDLSVDTLEPSSPARPSLARRSIWNGRDWLFLAVLAVVVLLVYRPAWHGGWLFDDDSNLTKLDLNTLDGLRRIWFQPLTTPQYYPLVYTTFWIEHHFWDDYTLGYHLVNIALHVAAAALVLCVLRRLQIPGAWLAAGIFALHPVAVESVAWITERKNTLSTVFYLAAMLCYLLFDESRRKRWYASALALFVLALLSKTVTVTLPAALWVVFWWQRGRLSWKRDVRPLVPLFALSAAAGAVTMWWEQATGVHGAELEFSLIQRVLIAGRAAWFYAAKLISPVNLTFIYPRWTINPRVWWQYLFPLGALALLTAAWLARRRTRALLAALLFFGGTLVPTLGLFNVYFFQFSFVADHFQYLASLGILTLLAASMTMFCMQRGWQMQTAGKLAAVALLAFLATLSCRQSQMYADAETLYRTTIAENPDSWVLYCNLGALLTRQHKTGEAIACFEKALTANPNIAESHYNLGSALAAQGRSAEAVDHFQRALAIQPTYAEAHDNLGLALLEQGKIDGAIAQFDAALEIKPDLSDAYNNRATALARQGKAAEAIADYQKALELKPDFVEALDNLGVALAGEGRIDEAIGQFRKALEIRPLSAESHNNLAIVLSRQGNLTEAIGHYEQALAIRPDLAEAHFNLGRALLAQGRSAAVDHWREAARLEPNQIMFLHRTAWALATSTDRSIRDGVKAVELGQQAVQLSGGRDPAVLDVLAAAYAEAGEFPKAVETAQQALSLATAQDKDALQVALAARIKLYQAGTPYREP